MQWEDIRTFVSNRPLMRRFKDCQIRKSTPNRTKVIPKICVRFYGQIIRHLFPSFSLLNYDNIHESLCTCIQQKSIL